VGWQRIGVSGVLAPGAKAGWEAGDPGGHSLVIAQAVVHRQSAPAPVRHFPRAQSALLDLLGFSSRSPDSAKKQPRFGTMGTVRHLAGWKKVRRGGRLGTEVRRGCEATGACDLCGGGRGAG
jgi:hypothetical protein